MTFYRNDDGRHDIAAAYGERLVPWLFAHWADRLLDVARPGRSAHVIDLACGTGLITEALLNRLDDRGRVRSVDLDRAALAYASAAVSDDRVTWHEADASQLPFEASTVDVVVCNQGLQFFPDRRAVLAEVSRVLRPGGRLAVAVWGPLADNPWPAAMAAAIGDALGEDARWGAESVCGLGDAAEVGRLLVEGGFVDVDVVDVELTATHPDVRDAIDGQLAAVPSAASIEALGRDGRIKIIDAMAANLGDYTSSEGTLSMPSTSVLAAATKRS